MPFPSTVLRNKEITLAACSHDGQFVFPEATGQAFPSSPGGGGNYKLNAFATFTGCTGGSNGYISDVTPSTSGSQNIINPLRCPLNMRPYLTRVDLAVMGTVSWSCSSPTSIPYLSIQDTLGTPLVHIPWSALRGCAALTFPDSDVFAPLYAGPNTIATPFGAAPVTSFTYSGGSITLASDVFSSLTSETQMVGTPVEIVAGKGIGQTALVAACAGGVMSLSCNWGSYGSTVAPDTTTSVLAIYWQPLASYGSTTVMTIPNGGGSPYTANVFDNGFNLLCVSGAGQGNSRPIASNTSGGALTLAYAINTAMNATTSVVAVTNEPNMDGSVDMVCDDKLSTAQTNTGVQLVWSAAGGTSPVGSNVRVYLEGYWSL